MGEGLGVHVCGFSGVCVWWPPPTPSVTGSGSVVGHVPPLAGLSPTADATGCFCRCLPGPSLPPAASAGAHQACPRHWLLQVVTSPSPLLASADATPNSGDTSCPCHGGQPMVPVAAAANSRPLSCSWPMQEEPLGTAQLRLSPELHRAAESRARLVRLTWSFQDSARATCCCREPNALELGAWLYSLPPSAAPRSQPGWQTVGLS